MRRALFFLIAFSILGSMVGCNTCGSAGCGLSSCTTDRCSNGRCGVGGRAHAHGVCDCEYDDYCSSRSPWLRHGVSTPGMPVVTTGPVSEGIPPPTSKSLPELKGKKL
jgi:hypothetical protein